jgi:hypothetical protein
VDSSWDLGLADQKKVELLDRIQGFFKYATEEDKKAFRAAWQFETDLEKIMDNLWVHPWQTRR